ncbi:MAG: beta-ketoacyl synthase chain length factor [Flavitalea sp.]
MFYIHKAICISPQQTLSENGIKELKESVKNKLHAIEPSYEGIPVKILRRMGKAVRIGIGAAMPLLQNNNEPLSGIIIGSAMGGMEDCINFLNQVIDYNEGMLTPTNFVQSTPNAIASQLGLLSKNKGYNITHVHRGLSFENAVIDAEMLLKEAPENNYLLGGVDEISTYNYNIDYLANFFKKEQLSNIDLYTSGSTGSMAGEGAAMFLVNGNPSNALATMRAIHILHSTDENFVSDQLKQFLKVNLGPAEEIDLFLSGENGDNRLLKFYTSCETVVGKAATVARYKHMSGEYPTSSAMAVWLTCTILQKNFVPDHMLKTSTVKNNFKRLLIYNTFRGAQHSFILVEI